MDLKEITSLPFVQVALPIMVTFVVAHVHQNKRIDDVGRRIDDLGRRMDEMGRRVDDLRTELTRRLERIEAKLDNHSERIARLEEKTSPFLR